MVEYWDRLRPLMEARGLDKAGLARLIGVSYQAVDKVSKGGAFGSANNIKAAAALGVTPTWLATGYGDKHPPFSAQPNVEPAPDFVSKKVVPVVGEVKGGEDGYLDELQYPVGHGIGTVEFPTRDPQAYALRVRGDSMHPRYRTGEFIVVSPSIEPQPGDDVVVALRDGRKLLKELNWLRDGDVQLLSVNSDFAPLTVASAEVESMHLVEGRVRRAVFRP